MLPRHSNHSWALPALLEYTDNKPVLNSAQTKAILRARHMKPLSNSCAYELWQNPAERPWKTLNNASREFLLRGFGDAGTELDAEAFWPFTHQQAADVENDIHAAGVRQRRASHQP